MSKHTPGPWITGEEHESEVEIVQVDRQGFPCRRICIVQTPIPFDDKTMHANANLIVAAPDLLEACKIHEKLSSHIWTCESCLHDDYCTERNDLKHEADSIRTEAIAKAEGKDG